MRRVFLAVAAVVALSNIVSCNQPKAKPTTRPAPPSGHSWVTINQANAAFLLPENWHYYNFGQFGSELRFLISPDEINPIVRPIRALEVQVYSFRNSEKVGANAIAVGFSNSTVERRAKDNPTGQIEPISLGEWHGRAFTGTYHYAPDDQKMTYCAAIASTKTGTCYVITFFTPVAEWDTLWPTGQVIAKQFILGDMPLPDGGIRTGY